MQRSDEQVTTTAPDDANDQHPPAAAAEEIPTGTTIDAAPAALESEPAEPGGAPGEAAADALAGERARLAPHGIRLGRDVAGAVRALGDEVLRLRGEAAQRDAEAKDGRAYRADLIDQLHTEGVRAFGGEGYDRERWGRLAGLMSIDELKATVADFGGKGAARFPGGRETHEHDAERGGTGPRGNGATTDVPDAAYRTGRRS